MINQWDWPPVVFIKKYYPLNGRLWLLLDVDFILVMIMIDTCWMQDAMNWR
jgi:hypothetical protein